MIASRLADGDVVESPQHLDDDKKDQIGNSRLSVSRFGTGRTLALEH